MRLRKTGGRAEVAAALWLLVACGQSKSDEFAEVDAPEASDSHASDASFPRVPPELPDTSEVDADGNRIEDGLDRELAELRAAAAGIDPVRAGAARAELGAPARMLVMLDGPVGDRELGAFARAGGTVHKVYRGLLYGFSATLPRDRVELAVEELRATVVLVQRGKKVVPHLDEATRNGRVRGVWAQDFAGLASGFSASSSINIAIVDSGIDATHPDLAGRQQYWFDATSEAEAGPIDVYSHGTHVAGIALGAGTAFGVGPAPLEYTDSSSLAGFDPGQFVPSPAHLPASPLTVSGTAAWSGGTTTNFGLVLGPDGGSNYTAWVDGAFTTGSSPLSFSTTFTPSTASRYSFLLSSPATTYTVRATVTNYPAVGDGFPALRGVASGARWAGLKVFRADGSSDGLDLLDGLEDLTAALVTNSIKVVNLSLGLEESGQQDLFFRSAMHTLVANGVVVVASAGNNGPDGIVSDPARARRVITVGASSDANRVTSYTSNGFAGAGNLEGSKPDVLAPGGSVHRSMILAADTNDADYQGIPDVRADDYSHKQGTSMAAPFVSGAAALVIQALESTGVTWTYADEDQPLYVKMLLGATATETDGNREGGAGPNPSLGRATSPKDTVEGWGIINPDAAIEAIRLDLGDGFTGSTSGGPHDKRAWGRRVSLAGGERLDVTLEVPSSGDFDLYLYADRPVNENTSLAEGVPNRLASSTGGIGADESLSYTATSDGLSYLVVKRVSGSGSFTLAADIPNQGTGGAGGAGEGGAGVGGGGAGSGGAGAGGGGAGSGGAGVGGGGAGSGGAGVGGGGAGGGAGAGAGGAGAGAGGAGAGGAGAGAGGAGAGGAGGVGGSTAGASGAGGLAGAGAGGSGGSAGSSAGISSGGTSSGAGGSAGSTAGTTSAGGSAGSTAGTTSAGGSAGSSAGTSSGGTSSGAGGSAGSTAGTTSAGGSAGSQSTGGSGGSSASGAAGTGGSSSGAAGSANAGSANAGSAGSASAGAAGSATGGNGGEAGGGGTGAGGVTTGGSGGTSDEGGQGGSLPIAGAPDAAGSPNEAGSAGAREPATPVTRTTKTDGGCGCDLPGKPNGSALPAVFAALAIAAGSRRRGRKRVAA